jgi:hypothetical protein
MLGLDPLLAEQVTAFLLDKYTITVSLLTLGPFLVRGVVCRREHAEPQATPPPTVASAPFDMPVPTRPPERFASYPFLTRVGVLTVLAYAGTTISASVHLRLNPPPSDPRHFTLQNRGKNAPGCSRGMNRRPAVDEPLF